MGFTRIRPEGDWTLNSTIDPEEAEALDDRYTAIDGATGGEHEPTTQIGIGGEGLGLAGENHEIREDAILTNSGTIEIPDGGLIRALLNGIVRIEDGGLLELLGTADGAGAELRLNTLSRILAQGTSGNEAQIRVGQYGRLRILANGLLDIEDDGIATVKSGAVLVVDDGGKIQVAGQILLTGDGDITVPSGGQIQGASGSIVTLAGTNSLSSLALVGASTWPALSTARDWSRSSLDVAWCSFQGGQNEGSAGEAMDVWSEKSDTSTGRALRTHPMAVSGGFSVVQFRDLPSGGIVSNVKIKTKGINNTVDQYPQFLLIRWQDGESGYESLSSLVTDGHSGGGDFDTTIVETTITPTTTTTIDNAYNYGLRILHPYYAALSTAVRIYNVKMTGTLATLRND